jgi:hypothetical protein
MSDYAAAAQIIASLAGTGMSAYQLANPPGTPQIPKAQPQDQTMLARALLPGQRANAAAQVGGGISPEFLAGLVGQEGGNPQGALDILQDIRRSINAPSGQV